jgi:NADH-quinone oxidoreductase subunit N
VIDAGFLWLAVVAVVFSLIGAFYYLRIVKLMYFDDPVDTTPIAGDTCKRALLALNGVAVLVLGLVPGPLMSLCLNAITHTLPL